MIDYDAVQAVLTEAVGEYGGTAPTVAAWADDLYVRVNEDPDRVALSELAFLSRLREDGLWMHPNYAANAVYKLMHRLGRDVTGHAGF